MGRVVAGWGLVLAARLLELSEIPSITVADLSEVELRALRLTLNRLGEESDWDRDELRIELAEILELDSAFELESTGLSLMREAGLTSDLSDEPHCGLIAVPLRSETAEEWENRHRDVRAPLDYWNEQNAAKQVREKGKDSPDDNEG